MTKQQAERYTDEQLNSKISLSQELLSSGNPQPTKRDVRLLRSIDAMRAVLADRFIARHSIGSAS